MELTIIRILVLVFSVVVHEYAHGWAAWRLGDNTARDSGRLTLNPLPHLDPVGSILVPLVLSFTNSIMLGWAKPVPVMVGKLNNPRDDHPKVAAAGPASNLLIALVAAILLGLMLRFGGGMTAIAQAQGAGEPSLHVFLFQLLRTAIFINVVLAMFNLLPLPPLDGSWILIRFLSPAAQASYLQLHRYGMFLVIGFLLLIRYTPFGGVVESGLMGVVRPFFELSLSIAGLGAG